MKTLRLKKVLLSSITVLTVIFSAFFITSCNQGKESVFIKSDETMIEEKLETFENKFNSGDWDGVIECFDSKTRNTINAFSNVADGVVDIGADISDLFALGMAVSPDDMMTIEILNVVINDENNALVSTNFTLDKENLLATFIMAKEDGDWYISDIKPGNVNNTQIDASAINVSKIYKDEGMWKVKFSLSEKNYYGVINPNGEIIYHADAENEFEWFSAGNGAGFVIQYNDTYHRLSEASIIVYDSKGNNTITLDGESVDGVLACDKEMLLLYKDNSSIDKVEHCYGVLSCDGKWIQELTPCDVKLPLWNISKCVDGKYLGEGVFFLNYSDYTQVFYNYKTNTVFETSRLKIFEDSFSDGAILSKCFDEIYYYAADSEVDLPGYFKLHPDGTFAPVDEFSKLGNMFVNTTGEYLQIYDNENTYEYKTYPLEKIKSMQGSEDYIFIAIRGADNKNYFTVIDSKGNQIFEPKRYEGFEQFGDDRVVYKTENGYWKMITFRGDDIISEEEKCTKTITQIVGNTYMTYSEQFGYRLFDQNGNTINITLKN